ncbi:MAG TPA: DUF6622 family protein [Paraburkholderia sp.]|jgi:hypothetical protein|nr:DUF6622 family protein [Paraburkholderia sp.]
MSPVEIIQGTPIWVWVLLVYLLSRGFKALHSGTAPLSRLAIIPVVFAGWGILHLLTYPLAGWSAALAWIVAALAGVLGGVFIASRSRFIVDPAANTVMLPGSVVPLVLILITFATKFWLGFELATVTNLSMLGLYTVIDAAVSGIVAGVFGGRFLTYWRAMSARRIVQGCSQSGA